MTNTIKYKSEDSLLLINYAKIVLKKELAFCNSFIYYTITWLKHGGHMADTWVAHG